MKRLYVVGIGPGNREYITYEATSALEESEVICGYGVYNDLVRPLYPRKEYVETSMGGEIERCKIALEKANSGLTTSVICSGDAGVYGMATLIYELNDAREDVEIIIVPGVTAALSGAAVLGAPLAHDFTVMSLSDLLTSKDLIEKRLEAVGMGDFAVALYNPSSKKRNDYLMWACDILLKYKDSNTVCGWVKNIGREGQESKIMTLSELREEKTDMFTTVFIGNSETKIIGNKMVTPRGYSKKGVI